VLLCHISGPSVSFSNKWIYIFFQGAFIVLCSMFIVFTVQSNILNIVTRLCAGLGSHPDKGVINEQCTYKIQLGNQSCIDAIRLLNGEKSSALHLQICTTQTLNFLLP